MYFVEDEHFARQLQSEFDYMQNSNVMVETPKKENQNPVHSNLEFSDPTPSIHDLFVKFSKKFFWNALGMVEVTWSNRMTKCAGMCTFHKRQGHCKISLSAPLLSLRPRKDLVETLLHEMIHAYLFVTNNNRDREDHGPEFHKHMFRINKEAGTKITVYHSFHEEVEYYQRHIWRCDGPCRNKKPFFGFVKRAMNRAPGPSDNWWNQHKMECNGNFIKISEPEKKPKGERKNKVGVGRKKIKDIRDFFSPEKSPKPPISQGNNSKKPSNIMTLADLTNNKCMTGLKSNNAGTLVVTNPAKSKGTSSQASNSVKSKNPCEKNNMNETQSSVQKGKFKNSQTKVLEEDQNSEKVREVVRNAWLNKFSLVAKSPDADTLKKLKVECPVCGNGFSDERIQSHIESCTKCPGKSETKSLESEGSVKELKQCPVCSEKVSESKMNEHLENCLKCSFANENEMDGDNEVECQSVPCPCCYKWFLEDDMNSHIDECLTINMLKSEIFSS